MADTHTDPAIGRALALASVAVGVCSPPRRIANGGKSIIYWARTERGEAVTIKILDFGRIAQERLQIAKNSLRHEADVLAAVTTPLVPRLLDCDPAAGFLVRQFVAGSVVQDVLRTETFAPDARLQLCGRLLDTARQLFRKFHEWPSGGHVIRDFKPRNLIAPDDGSGLVLVDVGGVRAERSMLSNHPRRHRIGAGSWRYWPPEQLLERIDLLDRRVDYFALGSTLFALLFGSPPYANRSDASSLVADYERRHAELRDWIRRAPDVPPRLGEFIVRCLVPDPSQRPTVVLSGMEAMS